MTDTSIVSKVQEEAHDLEQKISSLREWKGSTDFAELPEKQQGLLLMQLNAMELYLDILYMRIDEIAPESSEE